MSTPKLRWVVDWDGTITQKDTIGNLAYIACERHKHRTKDQIIPPEDVDSIWNDIVSAYIKDYDQHLRSYRPPASERKTLQEEIRWLESLRPVEQRSIERVEKSQIFKGLTDSDIQTGAEQAVESEKITLRLGWETLLLTQPGPVILSVNWSTAFIRSVIRANISRSALSEEQKAALILRYVVEDFPIPGNELPGLFTSGGTTGKMSLGPGSGSELRTSADKLRAFQSFKRADEFRDDKWVYIGDSTTDLECLLAADVGIMIVDDPRGRGQKELFETLQRVGVWTQHVSSISRETLEGPGKIVWWMNNFKDILKTAERIKQAYSS